MPANLFEQYITGGGWAMLVLVPASVVALATMMRAWFLMRGGPLQRLSADVQATVSGLRGHMRPGIADARVIAMDAALRVYHVLQPLVLVYTVAPLVGAAGTAWKLHTAWRATGAGAAANSERLSVALQQAFVPLMWGVAVALVSVTGYTMLRARLLRIEREVLTPAAIAALDSTGGAAGGRGNGR